uniref:Uncharacterized protein n=1 Tax=Candidatus Kentrum sp. FM TaxID=2126340 RepID=A0A450SWL1_9GAMM|nr:MAG: hypothetical protein BECKFM1743C_GA0114222_102231 [Candidatus Kentron sp. FM]VFJ65565.1 MAG: hypothetical protein BECKFM1743A_GA0114220_103851 [Candidatus Kentron sp. FM]VFK15559.1 MAG: hypothetical protein BECKFM1743B_GA0114221_103771 [Candidatus Kentron sp. FM]
MNFQEIENGALHLPERDRAELVQNLLISLDAHTEPRKVTTHGLAQTQRGTGEFDREIVQPVPSEEVTRKARPMDVAFLRSLEGTFNERTPEADKQASREAIKELLRKTRGSMKLGKTLEGIDAEIRIMRDEWERTWE